MRKTLQILFVTVLALGAWSTANAWTINFENGVNHDGENIASGIPGLQFTTTAGQNWIYGDASNPTAYGAYNVQNQHGDFGGAYFMEDNVFAWLGPNQGAGRVDFLNQDASFFRTGYSAATAFYVEAYDKDGNLIDSKAGGANNANFGGTGLDYLQVNSASHNIAYVLCHDTGNFWLTDNMSGDATGVPDQTPPGGVPEPATMLLFGLGLVGGAIRKRMQK